MDRVSFPLSHLTGLFLIRPYLGTWIQKYAKYPPRPDDRLNGSSCIIIAYIIARKMRERYATVPIGGKFREIKFRMNYA